MFPAGIDVAPLEIGDRPFGIDVATPGVVPTSGLVVPTPGLTCAGAVADGVVSPGNERVGVVGGIDSGDVGETTCGVGPVGSNGEVVLTGTHAVEGRFDGCWASFTVVVDRLCDGGNVP